MIKIIKVYRDSRILENGTLDTLGLAIKNDNNFDILRFKFDEFVDGVGSLLTTLEDDNNEKVAFPLTKNAEENSYDLVITREIASTNELEFQLLITYEDDVVWHSRIAKLQILNALDVGTGEMPTTIENWLENANLVMSGYGEQINQWGEEIEQAVTGAENVNIEVEEGENLYNVTITDRNGNEYQAVIYQGANAVISGATASVDQTIGTPSVVVTIGGTESDRTFDFAFHNLKGEKGEKGDKGDAGAIKMQIVDQLPPTGSDDTIYLVPITPDVTGNNYAEYVYINGQWELLGKIGVQVDLTDYVKNTDYATNQKGGVFKVEYIFGTNIYNGFLIARPFTYEQYQSVDQGAIVGKATLENVITGKGLVSNTDYATSSKGGVIKTSWARGTGMAESGSTLIASLFSYDNYMNSIGDYAFIGKGTLENVITGKQLINQSTLNSSQATQDTKITNLENQVFGDETIEGEGTSLTLNGTLKGQFNSIDLKGNTSQDGTPTPTTPIPVNVVSGDNEIRVCGKNLAYMKNGTYSYGVNTGVITDNNKFTLNTNASYGAYGYFSFANGYTQQWAPESNISGINDMNITPNGGNYIFTINTSTTIANTAVFYVWSSTGRNFNTTIHTSTSKTLSISLNEGEHIKDFGIWTNNNNIFSNWELTLQLEVGSSASTYEPYQGNTYNIDLPVENLFPEFSIADRTASGLEIKRNSDNTLLIRGTSTAVVNNWINDLNVSLNSGTYTFSTNYDLGSKITIVLKDNNSQNIAQFNLGKSATFSINETTIFNQMLVQVASGVTIDNSFTFQLEKGTKANTYTPYGTTPIELCSSPDENKRDYLWHDKTLDKWYWHREILKVVLNGSENWTTRQGGTSYAYALQDVFDKYRTTGLCNYFQFIDGGASGSQSNECIASANTNGSANIFTNNSSLNSLENFKTWLSTHNLIIHYVLATPTNTEITYQPLIDQLNELEKAMSKDGQTNISQVNNDLPFIISASAFLNNINGKIGLLNKLTEV